MDLVLPHILTTVCLISEYPLQLDKKQRRDCLTWSTGNGICSKLDAFGSRWPLFCTIHLRVQYLHARFQLRITLDVPNMMAIIVKTRDRAKSNCEFFRVSTANQLVVRLSAARNIKTESRATYTLRSYPLSMGKTIICFPSNDCPLVLDIYLIFSLLSALLSI